MAGKVLWIIVCVISILLTAAASKADLQKNPSPFEAEPGPATYEVVLEKENPNGVVVTEKRIETVWSAEDFWMKYREWDVIDQNQEQIILRKPYEEQ